MARRFAFHALCVSLAGTVLLQAQTPGQGAPVSGTIEVRLVEAIDSTRDAAGRQFRGVVAEHVNAGSVSIPLNSIANMTLTESGRTFTVAITSVVMNGQPLAVTSGPPTVVQGADGGLGQILGRLGLPGGIPGAIPGATPLASGPRVALLPGTRLRFSFTATTALAAAGAPAAAATPATGPAAGAGTTGSFAASSVKETLLGPSKPQGMYVVSPDGGHYAVLSNKGSREVVIIDGVEGPEFDRAGHIQASLGGLNDFAFNSNGLHAAYMGQRGDNLIAVIDGKEAFTITSINQSVSGTLMKFEQMYVHDRNETREVARPFLISPGGHVAVAAMEVGGTTYMFLDGMKSPPYRQIDAKQIAFVGEKLVYAALTQDGKWHVVENTRLGPAYDGIRSLNVSDNDQHYAFIANGGNAGIVVADGVPGTPRAVGTFGINRDLVVANNGRVAYMVLTPRPDGRGASSALYVDDKLVYSDTVPFAAYYDNGGYRNVNIALFSPDGKKFAYARPAPGGVAAVIDGKQSLAYDNIGVVGFSPDSRRAFFVGNKSVTGNYVVIDGQEMPERTNLKEFTFSQDGSHFGYVAQHIPEGNVVIIDGKAYGGKVFAPMDKSIAFSADGKHTVWGSCGLYNDCQLVRDGIATKTLQLGYFITRMNPPTASAAVLFSPDGTRLAYTRGGVVGASAAVFVDERDLGHAAGFSFRAFSPDSQHFAALGRTATGSMFFIDGKAGPSYEDVLEANLNAMVWTDARTLRVLAVKGGMVYRVTADAGN